MVNPLEEISNGLKLMKLLKSVIATIKHNKMQQFKEMHLTAPQGMLMGMLAHYGKMKVSDLSEKLGLSNSTVSGIIDRLEKQGLVERTRSEEDRRVVYVDVTSAYKKHTQEHFMKMEEEFEAKMKNATPEELDTVFKGLETLKRLLERQM